MKVYLEGLRFSCRKCGECCISGREDMGVFLYLPDLLRISKRLCLAPEAFAREFCRVRREMLGRRIIPRLQVLKKEGGACLFLEKGRCTIYSDRPVLCRLGPFVRGFMESAEFLDLFRTYCRGMDKGRLRGPREIEGLLGEEERLEQEYQIDLATDGHLINIFKR